MNLPPPPEPYGQLPPTGPPHWGTQPQWVSGPPPPPKGGGKAKWIFGGLSVVLAIALAVVITVLVVRPDGESRSADDGSGTTDSEFASANDTGPVSIITEDPTCDAWGRVAREYYDATQAEGWGDRDYTTPAVSWTPQQRIMYESVGKAMGRAAEKTIALSKQTPHRVMRELYQQFIAYSNSFVSRIADYKPDDDDIAVAADAFMISAANICSAIDYGSAQAVGPQVLGVSGLASGPQPLSASDPAVLLPEPNAICSDWASLVTKYSDDTANWRDLDKRVPAKEWTPEERSLYMSVAEIMSINADEMERLGQRSGDATIHDLAVIAAQYQRGFVTAIPSYIAADNLLAESATQLMRTINWACKASR
ncbi:hypothetical protein [Mycolicibacterium smegmatis]|uniref:hypothetical protein n=1 Tax=Mycolicibacterium smegmatis TaxID=1772 RepID=UPI0013030EB2|nr:hypothetical protein [Mycolicibacterium smegmatis]